MSRGLAFILIASVAAGLWSILLSRASRLVHPILGTGVVESSAVLLVLLVILRQRLEIRGSMSFEGLALLGVCGVCVFAVDYFSLRAYDTGLEVSVGAPIIASGAILLPALVGTVLGERISTAKVVGIVLIGAGTIVLTRLSG
jgi:drug/metabolite transporter (DMT)-like permease